jgi:hypothetical protein
MGIRDFYPHVKSRFKKHPLKTATLDTIHDVYIGGLRRIEAAIFAKYDSHWNENWDILVVLDACRTDLFEQVVEEHEWLPEKKRHNDVAEPWIYLKRMA